MSLFKRFFAFQHERFPLRILTFTTLSSVLASVAVSGCTVSIYDIIVAFFVGIFIVFHIRVIDESRDFNHDSAHYPNRPVNTGAISLKELFYIDLLGLLISSIIAFSYGNAALWWFIMLLVFTTIAWKDFFASKFFDGKPLLYHIVNSPQMVMLQLFLYAILTRSGVLTYTMLLQMFLLYINVFILEVVRKVKIKEEETTANDTYSKSMGFSAALVFTILMVICALVVYSLILFEISDGSHGFILGGIVISIFSIYSILKHIQKQTKSSEKLVLLSSILVYVGLNTLLYLSIL